MKAKGLIVICFCLISEFLSAQQLPLFSQQTFNRFGFNPACAGSKNSVDAMLTHRTHMVNFPGAPTTQLLTVSAPWQQINMGFGLRVLNDNIGVSNSLSVNLATNYVLTLGTGKLSLGLEIGADQYSVDWDQLVRYNDEDEIIPQSEASITTPNGAFGLFYTTENWYFGYSVQNLYPSRLIFAGEETDYSARKYATHYFNVGGVKKLNDDFQLEPYALIKGTKSTWQMDLGSYVVLKQKYGAGLAYRTGDALVVTLKFDLPEKFYIGYSYDVRFNSLSTYTNSSHEFMLGYYYKLLEPARKKSIHPRYYF